MEPSLFSSSTIMHPYESTIDFSQPVHSSQYTPFPPASFQHPYVPHPQTYLRMAHPNQSWTFPASYPTSYPVLASAPYVLSSSNQLQSSTFVTPSPCLNTLVIPSHDPLPSPGNLP